MSIPVEVFRFLTIDCELGPAPELLSASVSLVSANNRFLVDEPQPPTELKSYKKYIQRCMSFTEKIVVGQISGKVMHSGKVMYMSFTENSFKVMQECKDPLAL